MQVTLTVKNLKKVMSQLKQLNKQLEPDFQEIVKGGGQLIRGEAVKSIQQGSKSGVVYEKYNPRRSHRASAPGEAPASDTGNLVSKIIVKQKTKNITNVESNANYSAFLEYGTSKMQPRPFMLPAFEKSKKPITEATFKRVVKKIEEIVK
jgi:HK97 gp10 family phage protein|tara:strand:+ start:67 stop:516 length:450 start_codon:yes stop_codon:yes gene_type:complete